MELNAPAVPSHRAAPVAEQSREQLLYARLLDGGTGIGLVVMLAAFAAYVTGWLPPRLAVHELQLLWHLPVNEFLHRTGAPVGWAWLAQAHHGDLAGLVGIALLASCSLPCLLAMVPLYLRAGDRVYATICLAEVAVLLLAASGVLTAAH
jgi:hypothetical protein